MNVTIRGYRVSLALMTVVACGLSLYSYTVNERIRDVNRMLDEEKLRREALLGEKLMIEKALVKARVRLASFENSYNNVARSSASDRYSLSGERVMVSDEYKENQKAD